MPNALKQYAEARPTPRNKLMGLLADALTAANDYAQKPDPTMPMGKANPVLGLLADGVSLNSLATTANRASYGEPLTNAGKANVPLLKPETADALMMAPLSPRNALAMMGGGMDTGAAKAIFAGIGAKTADKAALAKAEKLAAAGADPKAIWRDTGWFKGGDGKWRFEIDDSAAGMRLEGPKFGADPETAYNKMGEAVFHQPAFKAYPDLKGVNVSYRKQGGNGSYSAPRGPGQYEYIDIGFGVGKDTQRQTMLHEMQHAIQNREGFQAGGNPATFDQQAIAEKARDLLAWQREVKRKLEQSPDLQWHQAEQAVIKEYNEIGAADMLPTPEVRDMARNPFKYFDSPPEDFVKLYGLDQRVTPYTGMDIYKRLGGEAEAQAVEARRNFTPQQRREVFPLDSYDVPINSLIYR